jgi:thioredoxin 1
MNVEKFKNLVSSGEKCVVKLGASWCSPCKALDKEIDLLLSEHPEVETKIFKVDIDDSPELAQELNIMSVPVCVFIGDNTYTIKKGLLARQGIFEWIK